MRKLIFILTALLFISNVYSQDVITREMSALIKKGNKVFLEMDKESITGEYLTKEFNKWRYWTVVEDVQDAQFIIAIHIKAPEKNNAYGMFAEAFAEFKTLENQIFITSKTYSHSAAMINGFNAFKGAAMKLMSKYFKKEFKK